jgi:dGTPase
MTALARYASRPEVSRGRLWPEPESATRSVFQRDRDRIVHATAFRRLMHKTQVFVRQEGDHYRTRLTHSIEVAQIARSISRTLGLNEDLAEAVALAHDLGHPPFGHAGEEALDEAMAPYGGFDHNEQTFRILTLLERRYAAFDGLNLTWEALEGIVKHNGPLTGPDAGAKAAARGVPASIARYAAGQQDLELGGWPGPEAQVAALADDIAYNNHDIDDGLRAGLFSIADLSELAMTREVFGEVAARYPGLETTRLIHESVRRLIDRMVSDLIEETRRRLALCEPRSVEDVRRHGGPLVGFSEEMRNKERALKRFLFARMYRHERVMGAAADGKHVVRELFDAYLQDPDLLPPEWRDAASGEPTAGASTTGPAAARRVADYIAGMTDHFAFEAHRRLIGSETS